MFAHVLHSFQSLIMVSGFNMLFLLFIPHVFPLKVLSFEKLNFVNERNNISSFSLKFEIDQVCKMRIYVSV